MRPVIVCGSECEHVHDNELRPMGAAVQLGICASYGWEKCSAWDTVMTYAAFFYLDTPVRLAL